VVWQRIADRLNLTNLDYLQQLKNWKHIPFYISSGYYRP
jgi:hypothetical protein